MLHEFSSRLSHSECCPHAESFFFCCTVRTCNSSPDQVRLSDGSGSKSQICKFDLGFPRIEQNVEVLIRPKYFGKLLLVLSRHKLSCEQFSSPLLPTTFFHDALFQHRLVRNDGVDAVCQNSFLRRGHVNSLLCVLCRYFTFLDFLTSVIASTSSASLLVKKIVSFPCAIEF